VIDRLIGYAIVALVVAVVVGAVGTLAVGASTRSACLALGYPDYRISAMWRRYCVARVDESDVVVPLDEAIARRR
jgi:hypothetical protein